VPSRETWRRASPLNDFIGLVEQFMPHRNLSDRFFHGDICQASGLDIERKRVMF
jgi:hypothetical protein